jgi:hypothetical protein
MLRPAKASRAVSAFLVGLCYFARRREEFVKSI